MTDDDTFSPEEKARFIAAVEIEPPSGLEARILAAIAAEPQRPKLRVIHNRRWQISLQIAAAVLLIFGATTVLSPKPEMSDAQLSDELHNVWMDIDNVNTQTQHIDEATNWVDNESVETNDSSGT